MNVSVVIPTYQGLKRLPVVLRALEKQTFEPLQVIVIIDGSTDGSAQWIKSQNFNIPGLQVVEQSNKGRAGVRNAALKYVTGELLIFFDDDMRPEPNCIQAHVEFHQKFRNAILTGGNIEDTTMIATDIQRYKAWLSKKWISDLTGNKVESITRITLDNFYLSASNFSLHTSLFVELGGFDDRLSDSEDFEFGMRALRASVPIYYVHRAMAWHHDVITCKSYISRQREYRKSQLNIKQNFPELAPSPLIVSKGWKKLVYRFFASPVWVSLIDKEKLTFIPRKIRFKLYELVIHSLGYVYPEIEIK